MTETIPTPRRAPGPRPSLRAAIDAFCRWCLFDPRENGTWRAQIEACPCTDCPLHAVRPVTVGNSAFTAPSGPHLEPDGPPIRPAGAGRAS
jgi:hypothetical protein